MDNPSDENDKIGKQNKCFYLIYTWAFGSNSRYLLNNYFIFESNNNHYKVINNNSQLSVHNIRHCLFF